MQNQAKVLVDNVKVMSKGQITLPKDFRDALRLNTGDRVALVYDGEKIIMMNALHYAMKIFQDDMKGAAKEAGLETEEAVIDLIMEMRKGNVDNPDTVEEERGQAEKQLFERIAEAENRIQNGEKYMTTKELKTKLDI